MARQHRGYGRIYAAGALASDFGVIPLSREEIGLAVLECYQRSVALIQATAVGAIDRVRAYVQTHREGLFDLDERNRPRLSNERLDRHAGFLKTRRCRRILMMRHARWHREFGEDAGRMLVQLNAEGRLQITDGLQLQTQVRRNSDKDRVYAVIID